MFRQPRLQVIIGIFLALAVIALAIALGGCSTSSQPATNGETVQSTSEPSETPSAEVIENETTSVDGKWLGGEPGFEFSAKIKQNIISMDILMEGDVKAVYWQGTFVSEPEVGDTIISAADSEVLDASMFGSTEDAKDFEYDGETLKFDFTMMGVTETITLERQ